MKFVLVQKDCGLGVLPFTAPREAILAKHSRLHALRLRRVDGQADRLSLCHDHGLDLLGLHSCCASLCLPSLCWSFQQLPPKSTRRVKPPRRLPLASAGRSPARAASTLLITRRAAVPTANFF
jgi:hypothetical protein